MAKSRGVLIGIILLAVLALAGYHFFFKKQTETVVQKSNPLFLQNASDSFTVSMNHAVKEYLALKDAFVASDTTTIKITANAFSQKLDSLDWQQLNADTTLVSLARSLQKDIQTSCDAIAAANDLQKSRQAFQSCSDLLFDLLRSVQYKGAKLYQQFCPMAFNNTGAHWLSAEMEILNPYFGNKMLHCGEVKDSLSFAQ